MATIVTPALRAYLAEIQSETVLVELLIRRQGERFGIRHVRDGAKTDAELKVTELHQLRLLSQSTQNGEYRPLKCAPNLVDGWRCGPLGESELEQALHSIYPGAIADWHHFRLNPGSATDYRSFTARQSGMYRITTKLGDELVGKVVKSLCSPRFCLKQRVWNAPGMTADDRNEKSSVPCLEPCPVVLEMARKAVRMEQSERATVSMAREELETTMAALEELSKRPVAGARDFDLADPRNPRRIEFLLEKLLPVWEALRSSSEGK